MLNKEYLFLNNEVVDFLKNYIKQLCVNRNKYFGNARTMRKIVVDVIHNQNLRMAEVPAAQRTLEMIKTVTANDLKDFNLEIEGKNIQREMIGFKTGSNR